MAQVFDGMLDLCRGKIGELHRGGGQCHKPIRMFLAPIRKPVVRRAYDLVCQTTVFYGIPPVAVDAQSLKVNAAPVHLLNALHVQSPPSGLAREFCIRNDRFYFIDGSVCMDVDHLHPLAADFHLPAYDRAGGLWYLARASAAPLPAAPRLSVQVRDAPGHG